MMKEAFFELVNAGLWERSVRLSPYGKIDFGEVYRLASEQQVVGLVAAGLGQVADGKVSGQEVAPFAGDALKLEQRNVAMNEFIARLFTVFRKNGASAVLVKGQGIAQCYERPLWRACGDIDLLLDEANYQDAKRNMLKKASSVIEEEDVKRKHLALVMGPWVVELHGTLHLKFLPRVNKMLDKLQAEVHERQKVRHWDNNGVDIPLPAPDEDVLFVFTHILEHFFELGVGLRQICDWCRLLHTYYAPVPMQGRGSIDRDLLEKRLRQMGILSEWKAFAAFAVTTLDMPPEQMPFYSPDRKWVRKAARIRSLILKSGNFGHNRDTGYIFAPFLKKKIISLGWMTLESIQHLLIFPKDSLLIWYSKLTDGIKRAALGK